MLFSLNPNCPDQIDINVYTDLVQSIFFSQCKVEKNLVVPQLFKLFFLLIDTQKKGFICEHDFFTFIQQMKKTEGDLTPIKSFMDDVISISRFL